MADNSFSLKSVGIETIDDLIKNLQEHKKANPDISKIYIEDNGMKHVEIAWFSTEQECTNPTSQNNGLPKRLVISQ